MKDANQEQRQKSHERTDKNPPQTYWQALNQRVGGLKGIAIGLLGFIGVAIGLIVFWHGLNLYWPKDGNTKTCVLIWILLICLCQIIAKSTGGWKIDATEVPPLALARGISPVRRAPHKQSLFFINNSVVDFGRYVKIARQVTYFSFHSRRPKAVMEIADRVFKFPHSVSLGFIPDPTKANSNYGVEVPRSEFFRRS
jgi:hypothetical protein